MAVDQAKAPGRQGWRVTLLASSASVIVICAIAGVGYGTDFGRRILHAAATRVHGSEDGASEFSKLMKQASDAMAQNQPRLAIIFLKNAVASAPQDGDAHLQLGLALLRAGDAASAEREARSARQYGASDDRVLPVIFAAMLARSEGRQLLTQFPAPADDDTSALASETLRARAMALTQTGDLKAAAATLDHALSFDKSAANLLARAQLARRMGDTDLAMRVIRDARAISPKDVSVLLAEVDLLSQANRKDEALAAANDLVKYFPNSPEALMTRAGVYLQLNQHEKAMADIDASLKAVPGMALGVYYKALAMEQAKDVKQAWDLAQTLPPAFINSRAEIGSAVSQMAVNAGHLEIGTSILSATVSNFPKDIDARVRLASRYLQLKDATHALASLQPLENSSDPRIVILLGQAYGLQQQYAKSIEYLEKASASGLGGDLLKRQIALTNFKAGNLDKAISELSKINMASPGDPQTAGPLIDALVQKNEYANALDVAAKLESSAPTNPYGPLFEGQIKLRQGDLDAGVSAFSRALGIDGKFIPAKYERAVALAARGDLDAANADLKSILSTDPKNMIVQIKIAQIAIQAGRKEEAATLLKQAADANPKEALPALVLAGFEMQRGHVQAAAAAVANFLNKVPDNASALAMQGEIQLASGKPDQAINTFRQLGTIYPKSPQIQMLLAVALAKNGNVKDALAAYQAAAKLAPDLQAARVAYIQYALAIKDDTAALSSALDYADKQPGPASAATLARAYVSLNRGKDAIDVLSDSQAKYPNGATLILLTSLLRQQGDAAKADAMLSDWIAAHPEDRTARLAYAQSLLNARPEEAEAQYRAVLKSQPYELSALNNLGWLLQQKNPKDALFYCERALKIAPGSPDVLDTYAWTKWLLKDRGDALSLLQRAHGLDPNNGEITYHLVVALDGNNRREDAKKLLADLLASKVGFADEKTAQALEAKWR